MHNNWRRYPFSKWYKIDQNAVLNLTLCCGAIWRHREKQQYRCTSTVPPVHNCQKHLGIFSSYMTFGAHKLLRSEPFLDYLYEVYTCCRRYIPTCGNFLYRCTSTFSALNYCGDFFKIRSAIYTKLCAQTFPPIFVLFTFFWPQFYENCGAAYRQKWELSRASETAITSEKKHYSCIKIDP